MLHPRRSLPLWLGILTALLLQGCREHTAPTPPDFTEATAPTADVPADSSAVPLPQPDTPTETRLRAMGLVDVQEVDSSIMVHLVYATADNFLGRVLYTDIHKAFMLPALATKLAAAQQQLHRSHPNLSLIVLDAARPLSVQRQMFHAVQGTPLNIYVSNPLHGPGMHNYGAAVDIALADSAGNLLPMGSAFDHFGPESHTDNETQLLATGTITQQEYDNRRLLHALMHQQGLQNLRSEWWHYNLMSRTQARQQLKPIDF